MVSAGVSVRLMWEPRDLWVGVFVDRRRPEYEYPSGDVSAPHVVAVRHRVYVCLVPCIVIVLTWRTAP